LCLALVVCVLLLVFEVVLLDQRLVEGVLGTLQIGYLRRKVTLSRPILFYF
jgi:hypothetical protein